MQYKFEDIAINSTAKKKPTEEDKDTYIGLEHLDSDCLYVTRWGADAAPTGEKLLMKKGDVLFGKRRAYQRKVGIAPFDGIFSAHGMVLRPNEEIIDKDFFPFFISSDQFMERAVRISVGGLSPTINWKDLRVQEFILPSIEEQRILADKLWAAYRLKESYKKLLTATQEMVKSQFIEMFGDTHMRSDHSRQWKEVVEIINGKDYKSIQVEDGGYPVYGTGGEMARASDYLSPANSILLGRKGTIDKPLLIREKYWNVDTAFGAVPDEKVLHYVYFYWHCKTIDFNVLNKGTTLPSTTKVDLLNLWIKIPSMEEQTRFGSIVEQADKSEFVGCKSQFIEMFYGGKYTVDKLRKHIDVIRGVSYKPSDVYETHNENTSIVLRSNNIEGGQINFDDLVYVSTDRVSEFQLLSAGDIVMCGSNGSKKLVGKAAMLQSTPIAHTSFGAFCLGIRCKPTLVPEYLATYFQTSLYRDKIEQLGSGSNILNIKPDHIYNLEIPIPLYDEQMAFVTIVKQADKSEYYN